MADAFVSFAVQKLGDFLIQQVSLRKNLRKEIEWLKNELLFIQSFLRDAELKQSRDQRVQQWVFEINSIANDVVAILETYSFQAGKSASRLKACACICRKEKKFYNVAEEIQSLKQRIMDISRKRETYGSLYQLKFLRFRGIHDLPSSIGNLKNLQTLVFDPVRYTFQLPSETVDLINLRHLVARYSEPLAHISKLTSLQVLERVCCDQWKDVDPVDLVNLRELSMLDIRKSYSLNNISSLENLSTLTLFCRGDESFPSLEFVNCCEKLQKLWLRGRIEKLPHLFPNSITIMVLQNSGLTEDPMPILGMLPNLRNLDLFRAYEGKEIMCSDSSFNQLEFLILYGLENLERWDLVTSAMPLIKGLGVDDCPNLKEIPERMKDVELLKRNYNKW
uniref:SNKR2GH5 protein n=1 Tax=Solanum tuberosum TaxID=4113 RepID=M1C4T7_SOLTU